MGDKLRLVLINRNYARLWSGEVISTIGNLLFDTILVLWIASTLARGQSWAALAVTGATVAATLPFMLVGPFAGVFVDRWPKRRTMLTMDVLSTLLTLLLLGIVSESSLISERLSVAWLLAFIYVIVFALNVCQQFFAPATFALIGELVQETQREQAVGMEQAIISAGRIIGPIVASGLYFTAGIQWALFLNALSFMVSWSAIRALIVPQEAQAPGPSAQQKKVFAEFKEGIQCLFGNYILSSILISLLLNEVNVGFQNALGVFFVLENLHEPAGFYGFLGTATGVGLASGAILAALFVRRIGSIRTFLFVLFAYGVLLLVYSRITNGALALLVMFLVGVTNSFLNVAVLPLIWQFTPKQLVARVRSVVYPSIYMVIMLASALAGFLASTVFYPLHVHIFGTTLGRVDILFTIAGILSCCSGFYAYIRLRNTTIRKNIANEEQQMSEVTH